MFCEVHQIGSDLDVDSGEEDDNLNQSSEVDVRNSRLIIHEFVFLYERKEHFPSRGRALPALLHLAFAVVLLHLLHFKN